VVAPIADLDVSSHGVMPKLGLNVLAGPEACENVSLYEFATVGVAASDHGVLSSVAVAKSAPFASGCAAPLPPPVPPLPAWKVGPDRKERLVDGVRVTKLTPAFGTKP
jgi:hypothetical protein